MKRFVLCVLAVFCGLLTVPFAYVLWYALAERYTVSLARQWIQAPTDFHYLLFWESFLWTGSVSRFVVGTFFLALFGCAAVAIWKMAWRSRADDRAGE